MGFFKMPQSRIVILWISTWVLVTSVAVKPSASKEKDILERYDLFADVVRRIEDQYVKEVDEEKLFQAALDGMVRSLDPHSQFLPPDLYEELKISTRGEFGGLGISIAIRDGILTIISPLEGTPADKAGLLPGDKVIEIEGESTKDITLEEAVKKLRGPKGTKVSIRIWRSLKTGGSRTKLVTMERDIIHIRSVEPEMLQDGIGYVRLNEFQGSSGDELKKAVIEMKEKGAKGLILDLRRNPGGLLSAAIEVAELFVAPGELIVYTLGRNGDQSNRYLAEANRREWNGPLVVLVDSGSASASEIVAGAIQDLKAGIIAGSTSFGKASVQNIYELADRSALKLTTAYYYTGSGKQIDGQGIHPDRVVDSDPMETLSELGEERDKLDDAQICAAMDILRSQMLLEESGLAQ